MRNFTKRKAGLFLLVMVVWLGDAYAQMSCVENHQIALNQSCQAIITPEDILQGNYADYSIYSVEIYDAYGQPMGTNIANHQMLDDSWQVRVTNTENNNYCTGSGIDFVDLMGPVIDCASSAVTIGCNEDLNSVPAPISVDNCSSVSSVQLVSESYQNLNICDDNSLVLERVWKAFDVHSNASEPCSQLITIQRTAISLPKDIVWTCEQYSFEPSIVSANPINLAIFDLDEYDGQNDIDVDGGLEEIYLQNTGSGVPIGAESAACKYSVSYQDQEIAGCGDEFQLLRTWTVIEGCSMTSYSHVQLITVKNMNGVSVDFDNSNGYLSSGSQLEYHVSANVQSAQQMPCKSTAFILFPTILGGCSGVDMSTLQIFTPVGKLVNTTNMGGFIPSPGLDIGVYPDGLIIQVNDLCGNMTSLLVDLIVEDDIVPTVICDQITKVGLSTGEVVVPAAVFDDGSYDNCCIDYFEVKRLNSTCSGKIEDLSFGTNISFCCDDIGQDVDVVMRVVDCYNNMSECQVIVQVEDLGVPQCFAPANVQIDCQQFDITLENYGELVAVDGCGIVDSIVEIVDWSQFENSCQTGEIVRSWSVWDQVGNKASCSQKIFVTTTGAYTIVFPDDQVDGLIDTILPVFLGNCGSTSWSVSDEKFVPLGQCFGKILRTFSTYNECDFNLSYTPIVVENPSGTFVGPTVGANNQNHGVFTYTQEIDIYDSMAPEVSCSMNSFCAEANLCSSNVTLSIVASDDFVPNAAIEFEYYYELDLDSDGTFDVLVLSQDVAAPSISKIVGSNTVQATIDISQVPIGQHRIVWSASDGCGHTEICESPFIVEDCESPSLACKSLNGSILMQNSVPGFTVSSAELVDALSDNCSTIGFEFAITQNGGQAIFEQNPNVQFDCDDVGVIPVVVWVKDHGGNTGSCSTTITLNDDNNLCDTRVVEGFVTMDNGDGIRNVIVTATPGNPNLNVYSSKTDATGHYYFALPSGTSYLIKLKKTDDTYQNGVDMEDASVLLDHILGTQYLPSVYKVLAANVLEKNIVNIPEVMEIKALVLGKITGFANVPIWRFANANVQFPKPMNPFDVHYQGHFINLLTNHQNVDFIGFKYGDLNNTTNTQKKLTGGNLFPQNRLEKKVFIQIEDVELIAGEDYKIPFVISSIESLKAYQFTLDFDPSSLEFVRVLGDEKSVEDNFNQQRAGEGLIATAYTGEIPRNQPIFVLEFKARKTGLLSDMLKLGDKITPCKGFSKNQKELGLELNFLSIDKIKPVVLFQNNPNPFTDVTSIGFKLANPQKIKLTIYSSEGRVIECREKSYPAGIHRELFYGNAFRGRGIYYYRLEANEKTYVKKMIKLN